jgi:hypothetical protein
MITDAKRVKHYDHSNPSATKALFNALTNHLKNATRHKEASESRGMSHDVVVVM